MIVTVLLGNIIAVCDATLECLGCEHKWLAFITPGSNVPWVRCPFCQSQRGVQVVGCRGQTPWRN